MIFSSTIAGVDRFEVGPPLERVHEVLAHGDQRLGAARREVEPAQQFLPARLARRMKLGDRLVGFFPIPGLDRGGDAVAVGPEPRSQRLEEGDARAGRHEGVLGEDFRGARYPRGLAAARQQVLALLD